MSDFARVMEIAKTADIPAKDEAAKDAPADTNWFAPGEWKPAEGTVNQAADIEDAAAPAPAPAPAPRPAPAPAKPAESESHSSRSRS